MSVDPKVRCRSDRCDEGAREDGEDDSPDRLLALGRLQQREDTRRLRTQTSRHRQEGERAAEDELDL